MTRITVLERSDMTPESEASLSSKHAVELEQRSRYHRTLDRRDPRTSPPHSPG